MICRTDGNSTEIFDISSHEGWLHAREQSDVWHSPGGMRMHYELWLSIPIWLLTINLGFLPALASFLWAVKTLRRARRRFLNHCQRCGYNLTGNTSGTCPECGHKLS